MLSLAAFGLAVVLAALAATSQPGAAETQAPGQVQSAGVYAADPQHPWNQLHRLLRLRVVPGGREYGLGDLDPLLWYETQRFLTRTSHQEALQFLDGFLQARAEKLISDRLKRAMLQRDLWAIFDWSALRNDTHRAERHALEARLARVMRGVALTVDEIRRLPDSYREAVAAKAFPAAYDPSQPRAAFLPPDLFDPDGSWVCLGQQNGGVAAQNHVFHFSGRSAFLAFLRLPGGRKETLAYLQKLGEGPYWIASPGSPNRVTLNPSFPQVPRGTQVALVRRMILPDGRGELVASPLIESIQFRVFKEVPPGTLQERDAAAQSQDVFELRLDLVKLFERKDGGLRAVAPEERGFLVFLSQGMDPFEPNPARFAPQPFPVLSSCMHCHTGPGIHSMMLWEHRLSLVESTPAREIQAVIDWKEKQQDWRLLDRLWGSH